MFKKYPLFFYILIILAVGFLVWFYSAIVFYILIAAVLSMIGSPIVKFLDRIRVPHVLSALLALLVLLGVFLSLIMIFVPLFIKEAEMVSRIDFKSIGAAFQEPLQNFKGFLVKYNILQEHQSIENYLSSRMSELVSIARFEGVVEHIIKTTGTFLVGLFSVFFITFFFLKDENMFRNIVLALTNEKYHRQTRVVLEKTRRLLQRYFVGLISDVLLMMTLVSLAMYLFGIHNAMLIGFFAGIVVIIPYIGPMIGATLALVIGVTSALSVDVHTAILPLALKILAIYFFINANDGLIFQPLIYGKSVKASPLEIFLILLISGTTAGIVGMAIAVPVYTVLRIIAKEFLSQFRPVKQLTAKI
ncbi:MAG: AI-2E family transporter [Bacteroidales bacterium]|nr:AI-2E family transporter [Bacteroidales bacterium]MCF8376248.1 AI-2E family transporter [Bacteroidales bacterium]MCF8401195.1 AI-2E family transporter [Bacteroidales bacterium]